MKSKLNKTCIVFALGLMVFEAQSASITLTPTSSTNINISGVVSFDMYANAADVGGILAGGLDLFYNSGILTYNGDFAFDAGFPTDPFFSRLGDDCATAPTANCSGSGEINGIAFGEFNGLAGSGMTLVGSLSFTGAAMGTSLLTMTDNDLPAGSWFDVSSNPINMVYAGSSVTVVPVPAAVWLFGSGLLGLIGITRQRGLTQVQPS